MANVKLGDSGMTPTVTVLLPLEDFDKLRNFLEAEEDSIARDEENKGDLLGLFKAVFDVPPE